MMKKNGENESNPRFTQLSQQLLAIQRAQSLKQLQAQQHQQQMQQSQHSSQPPQQQPRPVDGTPLQPGPAGRQASPGMNLQPTRPQENGQVNGIYLGRLVLIVGVGPAQPHPVRSGAPSQSFTPEQLHLLKNQILAFKKISKNLPIPENVVHTVIGTLRPAQTPEQTPQALPSQQTSPVQPPQPTQTPQEALNAAARIVEAPAAKQASPAPPPVSDEPPLLSPHQFFRRKITLADHARRDQRPLIPAIFPTGIDMEALRDGHQRAKENRIAARIQELESLDANLIDFPEDGQVRKETYTQKTKLRAMIELKALKLLDKQRLLRKVMARAVGRMTHLSTSPDRALYRRQKKVSLREARLTENLERQQRVDRERREKQKHDDYLQGILQHGREVLTNGRLRFQRWQRLGKSVVSYHSHVEKEEQRRIERTAKLRLAALKNDDEEAYL